MKEVWNFIDSGNCTPSFNMACDEALLIWQSEGKIRPTIRFYGWNPATLSIGYFQKVNQEINMDAVQTHELGFVRRPTGGRAVLHDNELTYSVIVSESHPKMPKSVTEAYRAISEGILEGFKGLGLDAYFAIPTTTFEVEQLKNPRSSVCFDTPSWYELVVEGRKVAGSAQTRQKGVILQHGSILLDLDETMLFSLFKFKDDRIKERLMNSFHHKAVSVKKLMGSPVTLEQVKDAFRQGFAKGLDVELDSYELSKEELAIIRNIEEEKYAKDEWNFKR